MFLEKVKISGFKSFAHKTELKFEGGVTAVVGPNGSGKSNIADAVRWVMGEQSKKNIRSKKGEDVIFAGSHSKSKAGMAEVSLFLNNSSKRIPVDFTEVELTRRLYRSGDSEYLLNSKKARLFDVKEILAKSGIGQSTYSIIGQGSIDRILYQKPEERRELFEDAAGVKQFYLKKDQALRRLVAAEENLTRVKDITREIEPRLKSLRRQTERAEKRRELEEELGKIYRDYFGGTMKEIAEKTKELSLKEDSFAKEIRLIESEIERINESLEKRGESTELAELSKEENKMSELSVNLQAASQKLLDAKSKAEIQKEKNSLYGQNKEKWQKESGEFVASIKNAEMDIEKLGKEILETESRINQHDTNLKKIDQRIEESQSDKKEGTIPEAIKRLREIENMQKRISASLARVKNITELKGIIDESERAAKMIDETATFLQDKDEKSMTELLVRKNKIQSVLSEEKLNLALKRQEKSIKEDEKHRLSGELRDIETKLSYKENGEEAKISENIKSYQSQVNKIEEEIDSVRQKIVSLREKSREEESRFFKFEREYRTKRDILSDYKDEMNKVEIERARLEAKKEDLVAEIKQVLGCPQEKINEKINTEKSLTAEEKENMEGRIGAIKKKLEMIGGVDPDAVNEHEEIEKRYKFLTEQSEDLTQASSSLKKVVLELDEKIHKQFVEKFYEINKKFKEYFQALFGGGVAQLVLEEGETFQESGIGISATPPGKKIKSLSTLSGGEKALTSIALIFAIFATNPSPFCVLDEVDAALDEANSARFAKILDQLSSKSQFIVITHNRETMKTAKVLYGVTMGDDKISNLISIKLEDAYKQVGVSKDKAEAKEAS